MKGEAKGKMWEERGERGKGQEEKGGGKSAGAVGWPAGWRTDPRTEPTD